MRRNVENAVFDEERALYNLTEACVTACTFAGEADGESALKEARDVNVDRCQFELRYPMWHVSRFELKDSVMTESCRAPLWYSSDGIIIGSTLNGIKTLRECNGIKIQNCNIASSEFGWKCHNISLNNMSIQSEYLFLDSTDVDISDIEMKGKYSFQYMKNVTIENSVLDTKDAFWHSENVVVKNSSVKGEYLGWYSNGLTLINCVITGTQPLCYCKNLKLIDCVMIGCDLAFEYSEVDAEIEGIIDSVKNPKSGHITADKIGEIILDDSVMECNAEITEKEA